MDDNYVTLPQAVKIFKRLGVKVHRQTIWRWATKGRKRPRPIKLNADIPHGFTRNLKVGVEDIKRFARELKRV